MSEVNKVTERRLSDRVPFNWPGSFHSAGSPVERALIGSTVEVSHGGLRLRVSEQPDLNLKKGDSILMRIGTEEPEGFINVQGQVRWFQPSSDSQRDWDIGVHLSQRELAKWALWLDQVSSLFAVLLGLEEGKVPGL